MCQAKNMQPALNIFPAPENTTLRHLLSTEMLLKHDTISLPKYTHEHTILLQVHSKFTYSITQKFSFNQKSENLLKETTENYKHLEIHGNK